MIKCTCNTSSLEYRSSCVAFSRGKVGEFRICEDATAGRVKVGFSWDVMSTKKIDKFGFVIIMDQDSHGTTSGVMNVEESSIINAKFSKSGT